MKSMTGVMPQSGACASAHETSGLRSSRASSVYAAVSFRCFGPNCKSVSASMASASRRFRAAVLRSGLSAGMKVLADELVDVLLEEVERFHLAAHSAQRIPVGIGQCPQVGGIHLCMAAEASEILVNDRGIEERV